MILSRDIPQYSWLIKCVLMKWLPWLSVFTSDVDLHRPKESRGNERDKLPSGVEPRSNDQQTSTLDTEPQSPDKSLSPHSLL